MIPQLLKDAQVFVDGRGYAGRCQKFKLPKLSRKMEEIMAGGMAGSIDADMGLEKLECSFDMYEWSSDIIALWGEVNAAGTGVRIMCALERDDGSEEVTPVQVELRGRLKMVEQGDIEHGKVTPMSCEMSLTYYRYTHNGTDLIEIDMVNMVEKVNGQDRLQARRDAIGL